MNHCASRFASALLPLVLPLVFQSKLLGEQDFGSTSPAAGAPDGMCDVWQMVYDAWGFDPAGDDDADGQDNAAEASAGTNPRNPVDLLQVAGMEAGPNLVFRVPAKRGKEYQLYGTSTLGVPFSTEAWNAEGAPLVAAEDASELILTIPRPALSPRFFVVSVRDIDSDNDGVSDWAEHKTGTDPTRATSPHNASSGTASDAETLRSLLTLTAETVASDAYEAGGVPAIVRLTRSYGTMPLAVPFHWAAGTDPAKGSASEGEFECRDAGGAPLTGGVVTIPEGASSADIQVVALPDALHEVPETLSLILGLPGPALAARGASASVRLCDAPNTDENRRLFLAYMRPPGGVTSSSSGIATLLLQGDNSLAEVNLNFSNLTSEQQNAYLNLSTVPASPGLNIILSLGRGQLSAVPWTPRAAQSLTTDQAMLDALFQSRIFLAVTTSAFGEGEITGAFAASAGSIDPPIHPDPDTPVALTGDDLRRDVARFLTQATFGPREAEITALAAEITNDYGGDRMAGYAAWIDRQLDPLQIPSPSFEALLRAADGEEFTHRGTSPRIYELTDGNNHPFERNRRREWWTLATQAKAQLRQRIAFALSQIFVVSEIDGTVLNYQYGLANYWDMLASNASGSYRGLLGGVARHPIMGVYLSSLKNRAAYPSGSSWIYPDENLAREIMQLFSIGLVHLHPDGSLKLGEDALPLSTYDQTDITEMARVFTGMSFSKRAQNVTFTAGGTQRTQRKGPAENNTSFGEGNGFRYFPEPWVNPLKMFGGSASVGGVSYYYHDFGEKTLFHDQSVQHVVSAKPPGEANAEADLDEALNVLASHPNTAPFIGRLLIQRLTTSNPSAGYIQRVASAWTSSGGDLGSVVQAILLDFEARDLTSLEQVGAGKLREPVLRFTHLLRAFHANSDAPVSALTSYLDGFSLPADGQASDYFLLPAADLHALEPGASRLRIGNLDNSLTQTPLRSPTVFNWFLPDYLVPGATAEAGLFLPEFQLANETNVFSQTNYLYTPIFASATPAFKYQTSGVNGTGMGAETFVGQGTTSPDSYRENIRLDFTEAIDLYTAAYAAAVAGGQTSTQANATASAALVDWLDGFLSCGRLKAKYGDTPDAPRRLIIDAVQSTSDVSSTYAGVKPLNRIRTALYLLVNSAEYLIQK